MLRILHIFFYLLLTCACHGQIENTMRNVKEKQLIISSDMTLIDSLIVVPESVIVRFSSTGGVKEALSDYTIDNNHIRVNSGNTPDSVMISYRTIDIPYKARYAHIDSSNITIKDKAIYIGYDLNPELSKKKLIQSEKLDYDGSFSRGISVGNRQNLVLNSNFNLQLAGDLGNGLEIKAAISDENLPIQPEGNTQTLQEFDKVYMELSKDNTKLIAGDYEVARPNSYFINYFKKLKGISLENNYVLSKNSNLASKTSFAISKGKFRRQTINATEGNQGPYKLDGNNGERFIIVLSGTEKIYLDGVLLRRGLEFDYTIDYNRSEIIFTEKILISLYSRVIAEFEYSDQNYLRTIYGINTDYRYKKLNVRFNLISEQDNKNSTGIVDLDSTDISTLIEAGDDPALRQSISIPVDIDQNRILYKLVDDILIYDPSSPDAIYTAIFSDVGDMIGSYIIDTEIAANGRVYKYVGPGSGSYLPVNQVVAPQKTQMVSIAADYKIHKDGKVFSEITLSNRDLNLFSPEGNNDNQDLASLIGYEGITKVGKNDRWTMKNRISLEQKGENFSPLNPYRSAEFSRDWNINTIDQYREWITQLSTSISDKKYYFQYDFTNFVQEGFYNGNRNYVQGRYKNNGWNIDLIGDILNTKQDLETTLFFKPKINIYKSFKRLRNWKIGYYLEQENNQFRLINSDELEEPSYVFTIQKHYIEKPLNDQFSLRLSYNTRTDRNVLNGALEQANNAREWELTGSYNMDNITNLSWNLKLRDFKVDEPLLTNEDARKTILGGVDYIFKSKNNGIYLNTNYRLSSGQEPKLEFTYTETIQPGEGTHVWIDYNDNEIQELNEFEIAQFQDQANYVKINLFNNEFIRTNRNEWNHSLRIDLDKFYRNKKTFGRVSNIAKRISFLSKLRVDNKVEDEGSGGGVVLFSFDTEDTSIVSTRNNLDNTIFFNRGNPAYDIQLSNRSNRSKIVQITGSEDRKLREWFLRTRINLKSKLDFINEISVGNTSHESESFDTRNFLINFVKVKPQISYRPTKNLRFITNYEYAERQDSSGLSAISHDLGVEANWRKTSKQSLDLKFNIVSISYNGLSNTPLEFELLQGLKNGSNYLWNISYTRRLANNIDLIINYEGRKTGDTARVVHVGRMQARANF